MDAEQVAEWSHFEEHAIALVRKGNISEQIGVARLVQIVALPSFHPAIGWELCRKVSRAGDSTYFGIYTYWRRDEDFKKFESPLERLKFPRTIYPKIDTKSCDLKSNAVEVFLNKLKSVSIPPCIETGTIGADGTRYEFSFGDYFLSASYRWWEDGPVEWKTLTGTVLELLKYLEGERENW
jgi:hypothetical protein